MKSRVLIIFFVIFTIAGGLPFPAFAASCQPPPMIVGDFYNFDRAHVVFVGTVTDVYNPHPEIHTGTEEYDTITFDMIRVLKGDTGDGTIRTGHDSGGFVKFEMGETYLVYAFGGIRDVGQCTPPILLSNASSLTIHEIVNYYYILILLIGISITILGIILWRKRKRR